MDVSAATPEPGFGLRLREAMANRGVGESELAREAEVSRWTIRNWLSESTRPELELLRRVAHALGYKPSELLGIPIDEGADNEINTTEALLVWMAQMQYQLQRNVKRVIEAEVQRRLLEQPNRPRRGRPPSSAAR